MKRIYEVTGVDYNNTCDDQTINLGLFTTLELAEAAVTEHIKDYVTDGEVFTWQEPTANMNSDLVKFISDSEDNMYIYIYGHKVKGDD